MEVTHVYGSLFLSSGPAGIPLGIRSVLPPLADRKDRVSKNREGILLSGEELVGRSKPGCGGHSSGLRILSSSPTVLNYSPDSR
jgi:hypothetical protein